MAVELDISALSNRVFVFALEREASAFRKRCPRARVEIIGVGPDRAAANVERIIEKSHPSSVVLAGYGGALREGLQVGAVVIADKIITDNPAAPVRIPSLKLSAIENTPLPGNVLSVSEIVGDPVEKRRLHQTFRADLVDLESHAVADVCERHGVPYTVVRAISDAFDTVISPPIRAIIKDGRVSYRRAMSALIQDFRTPLEMWRLQRHSKIASGTLAAFLMASSVD